MPEKKKGVVPRLRFPEFRDAGPWEVRTIEQLASKIAQGGTPKTSVPEYWNGEIPWITPAEMGDDAAHHYTETTLRAISREGRENSSTELLPANSVIISSRAPIGYVTINKVEMATNQGCKGIIPKRDTYHEFLYFSLLVAKQRLNNLGAGAGFKEISTSTLKAFQIPVPRFPEQQKIADCLSSLDEVIEMEARRLEALKAHKKGLMQQLFPREGETVPRLRFPEFRDAGPWEVKRLGEFVEITGGGTPSRSNKNFWDGSIPWVSSSDIPEDSIKQINVTRFITPEAIKKSATKLVPANSILLVSRVGVGKLAVSKEPICTSQDFTNLTPLNDDNVLFLAYYLKAISYVLESFNQGMAIKGFTKEDIENLELALPDADSGEQQKIADCLSSLDEVIELEAKRLDALKAHKKGLMQQLFPQEVG